MVAWLWSTRSIVKQTSGAGCSEPLLKVRLQQKPVLSSNHRCQARHQCISADPTAALHWLLWALLKVRLQQQTVGASHAEFVCTMPLPPRSALSCSFEVVCLFARLYIIAVLKIPASFPFPGCTQKVQLNVCWHAGDWRKADSSKDTLIVYRKP